MMIDAVIKEELGGKPWTEAANMGTDLDNILVNNKSNKNSYEIFYNKSESQIYFLLGIIWRSGIHPKKRKSNEE